VYHIRVCCEPKDPIFFASKNGDIGFGEAGDGIFLKRQSPLILLILFANSSHYKNIFN